MAITEIVDTVGGVLTKIIGDNAAQVSSNQLLANAVPKGVDWNNMGAAGGTSVRVIPYKGEWDWWPDSWATVKFAWAHSARYKNGGAFISSVYSWVEGSNIAPRCKLNVTFQASAPYLATQGKAPVAALPVTISFVENSPVDQMQEAYQYLLFGNGQIQKL
jgi:hypothetical protein